MIPPNPDKPEMIKIFHHERAAQALAPREHQISKGTFRGFGLS
jgi:hypothetical protein